MPFRRSRPAKPVAVRAQIVGARAGRAGVVVSVLMALIGVGLGGAASYLGGLGNSVTARYSGFAPGGGRHADITDIKPVPSLREGGRADLSGLENSAQEWRGILREGITRRRIVQKVLDEPASTGEPASIADNAGGLSAPRPQVAIIFDDLGPDPLAFDRIMALPGPLTLSFLPYARKLQPMVERATARGDAIMLHLPMEPVGPQNPGLHALKVASSPKRFRQDLEWNLNRFSGYSGVNNHMGSKLTADPQKMAKVLAALKKRGLYFVDSVTTAHTVVQEVAAGSGVVVLSRDVFLDPQAGAETVRRQLAQVEQIARRTGYAVAIAHPHSETIDMLGPWLTSARLRGFDLVTVDSLVAQEEVPLRAVIGARKVPKARETSEIKGAS